MKKKGVTVILGFACAGVGAVAAYPVFRVVASLTMHEGDPVSGTAGAHAGYFWRLWTTLYASGMLGMLGAVFARRDPLRVARLLAWTVPWAALLLVAQAILLP